MHNIGNDGGVVILSGGTLRIVGIEVFVVFSFALDQKFGKIDVAIGEQPQGAFLVRWIHLNFTLMSKLTE